MHRQTHIQLIYLTACSKGSPTLNWYDTLIWHLFLWFCPMRRYIHLTNYYMWCDVTVVWKSVNRKGCRADKAGAYGIMVCYDLYTNFHMQFIWKADGAKIFKQNAWNLSAVTCQHAQQPMKLLYLRLYLHMWCDGTNTYRNIRRLVYSWRMPWHVPVLALHSPLPELDFSRCAVALKENTHATCIYNNKQIRVGLFARKNWDVCGHWLSGNIAHKQTQRKRASAIVHK